MIGPLTALAARREPYLPTATERPEYERLANDGLADRAIVGGAIGYRISADGLGEFRAWLAAAQKLVRFP